MYFDLQNGGRFQWHSSNNNTLAGFSEISGGSLQPLSRVRSPKTVRATAPVKQLSNTHQHLLPSARTPGKPAAAGPLAHLMNNKMRPVIKTGRSFRDLMARPGITKSSAAKRMFRPNSRASSSSARADSRMSSNSDWQVSGSPVVLMKT